MPNWPTHEDAWRQFLAVLADDRKQAGELLADAQDEFEELEEAEKEALEAYEEWRSVERLRERVKELEENRGS